MPEGLFSNLKFTDILIPGIGAAASAYNPYIGQGLQTGMNLFNSMSSFQNDLRYWKKIKEDQEREDKDLDSLRRGASGYIDFASGLTAQSEDNIRRGLIQGINEQGRDAASQGVPESLSPGPPGLPDNQFFPGAPLRPDVTFADLMPEKEMEERASRALFSDAGHRGLQEREQAARLAQSGIGISPGSAMQTLGILGQQAFGQQIEKDRLDEVLAQDEARYIRKIKSDEAARRGRIDEVRKSTDIRTEAQKEVYGEWLDVATEINALSRGDSNLGFEDLQELYLRAQDRYEKLEFLLGPQHEIVRGAQMNINSLVRRLQAFEGRKGVPGDRYPPPKFDEDEADANSLYNSIF